MANSLLTINMITREAVRLWKNSNAFLQNVDMQYDDSFAVTGAKIGTALRIRLPNDFTVTTGPAISVQDTQEQSTTLTVATQKHVDAIVRQQMRMAALQRKKCPHMFGRQQKYDSRVFQSFSDLCSLTGSFS